MLESTSPATFRKTPPARPIERSKVEYQIPIETLLAPEVKKQESAPEKETAAESTPAPAKEASAESTPAPAAPPESLEADDVAAIDQLGKVYQDLKTELGKTIIGQENVIEELAICLFARGHGLLMGVPGLAKTPPRFLGCGNPPSEFQPNSVHARPHARRHFWNGHYPRQRRWW